MRAAIEGDENTWYFQASATQHFRKNKIAVPVDQGTEIFLHKEKAEILKKFFSDLIGTTKHTMWNFDLGSLYNSTLPQLHSLGLPFSEQKIYDAFLKMNPDASLAPDGFGPALYRSYWHTIKHIMILFFTNFHDHQANLERFNRAFMILPPRKDNLTSPDTFRTISL